MKQIYSVLPSEAVRIQGPRNAVDANYLPHSVMREDGSLLASFHSRAYAEKFSEAMNEAAVAQRVEKVQ